MSDFLKVGQMARPKKTQNQKLAEALRAAKKAAGGDDFHVLPGRELKRSERELLLSGGWLSLIINGWYALSAPGTKDGDSVVFYSNLWEFLAKNLGERLPGDYWLSPHQALALHCGSLTVPEQILVHTTRGGYHQRMELPHGVSVVIFENKNFPGKDETEEFGSYRLRLPSIDHILADLPPKMFNPPSPELEASLLAKRDFSGLARILLKTENVPSAGRLSELLKKLGRGDAGEEILRKMHSAGLLRAEDKKTKEDDASRDNSSGESGTAKTIVARTSPQNQSLIFTRMKSLWRRLSLQLSETVTPKPPCPVIAARDFSQVTASIKAIYVHDAYNSLSIESYRVTTELIERIARGEFSPEENGEDAKNAAAMAALGYFESHSRVLASLERVSGGGDAVSEAESNFSIWREELFAPSVRAGLLKPEILSGYRNKMIFIRDSRHMPPAAERLMDAVDGMFEAMREEKDPWTRAVLAHFFLVHVHPFSDGNGRTARFLMNFLLVAAGFPWTVVRHERRALYFGALEKAHIDFDAEELSRFLREEMESLRG